MKSQRWHLLPINQRFRQRKRAPLKVSAVPASNINTPPPHPLPSHDWWEFREEASGGRWGERKEKEEGWEEEKWPIFDRLSVKLLNVKRKKKPSGAGASPSWQNDNGLVIDPRLTWGGHVISLYVSHVRVQSTVQITLDNFPAVVVARAHQNEGRAAGQRDGFGHEKAHHYGEMEEK